LITYINIVFTLFLLLPGFISLKIRQSTREYKDLTTFEYTSISIGFSFLIFLLWLLINSIIFSIDNFHTSFINDLKKLIIDQNLDVLFSKFFVIFIITYMCAFLSFSLLMYNLHWIGFWSKILRKFGLTRFSSHLTPWEDFQILSKLDWIIVELKDGRTIVGKLGFGSHLPFDKEIVLKRTDLSPIEIYDKEKKRILYGPDIDLTYINYSDINLIHSTKDKSIEIGFQNIKDYTFVFLSLITSILMILVFFSLISLKIEGNFSHGFTVDLIVLLIAIFSCICNLKSLSKFS